MATGERKDPFRGFNFQRRNRQHHVGAFQRGQRAYGDGDIVEYREGTDLQLNVRKLMGLRKYSNIMLKRGYTAGRDAVGLVQ